MTCPAIAALAVGMICTAPVDRVADGDTFLTRFAGIPAKVRLARIDTPERGEPGWMAATDAARKRFQGRTVTITIGGPDGRRNGRCVGSAVLDRYGRVLATVPDWPETVAEWRKEDWCR